MTAAGDVSRGDDSPQQIGRYRIVERIGKGAMGMVYAADDETLGRRVAVKVMVADLEEEPESRERFYREARITGQLAHQNIVTVFDLGEHQGHPFLVMELLDGLPLTEYLHTPAAEPLDVKIDLMMQMCRGLQAAHRGGVIHRDIKPSNVFVERRALKILDFGVARLASSTLTATGLSLGTPEYMSPEQAQGRQVDARSDIFSAAGVFHFMLTGRSPFQSSDLPKVLHAVIHDDPAPLTEAHAPDGLRRILVKALQKSPTERYQHCDEMLADLERIQRGSASEMRADPPPVRNRGASDRGVSRRLVIYDGQRQREIPLLDRVVVGRDPACDVTENDSLLSRRHAEFVVDRGQVIVRDLGSRNGIFINGDKISERPLQSGDVVQMAYLQLRYVEDATPSADGGDADDADATAFFESARHPIVPPIVQAQARTVARAVTRFITRRR